MTKFICSADGTDMLNIAKIQRIFQVHEQMSRKIVRALLGKPLGTGIHCEISTLGGPITVTLMALYEIESIARVKLGISKAEQYVMAFSSRLEIDRLLRLLMLELQDRLIRGMTVIEICKVIESAIDSHIKMLFGDGFKDDDLTTEFEVEEFALPRSLAIGKSSYVASRRPPIRSSKTTRKEQSIWKDF